MALTSAQSVAAGDFFVALYTNGTTKPTLARAGIALAAINGLNSAANAIWATANTGLTTAMPATLGTFTAATNPIWVGVS